MKSCKDITELIEKKKIVGLNLGEKMQVKVHLAMCKLCRNFSKDSDYLDRILKKLRPSMSKLTKEERVEIKNKL
jgi:predicted anti-sigma-YlaC factor YlaD